MAEKLRQVYKRKPRDTGMLGYIALCQVMLGYVMLGYVMLGYVRLC
jgi:hypothetical protein